MKSPGSQSEPHTARPRSTSGETRRGSSAAIFRSGVRRLYRVDFVACVALALLPVFFHPLAALRRGVFYVGDVLRLHYPLRAAYTAALQRGTLPLWSPHVLAGFPLLAEGQTGVFYPPNLLLHRLLPLDLALNDSVLLSLSLAGVATYVLARRLRLSPPAAALSALAFVGGGFMTGHTNHLNILAAAAWLPAALIVVDRALDAGETVEGRPEEAPGPAGRSESWMKTVSAMGEGLPTEPVAPRSGDLRRSRGRRSAVVFSQEAPGPAGRSESWMKMGSREPTSCAAALC